MERAELAKVARRERRTDYRELADLLNLPRRSRGLHGQRRIHQPAKGLDPFLIQAGMLLDRMKGLAMKPEPNGIMGWEGACSFLAADIEARANPETYKGKKRIDMATACLVNILSWQESDFVAPTCARTAKSLAARAAVACVCAEESPRSAHRLPDVLQCVRDLGGEDALVNVLEGILEGRIDPKSSEDSKLILGLLRPGASTKAAVGRTRRPRGEVHDAKLKALLFKTEHPDWSDARCAEAAGLDPGLFSRYLTKQAKVAMGKRGGGLEDDGGRKGRSGGKRL